MTREFSFLFCLIDMLPSLTVVFFQTQQPGFSVDNPLRFFNHTVLYYSSQRFEPTTNIASRSHFSKILKRSLQNS